MQIETIIKFWGRDNLKRWTAASLRDVSIPVSSKSFLIEVGLPYRVDWTLQFDNEAEQLPRLPNKKNYRRIGYDDVVPLCLDEEDSGRIIAVEDVIGGRERFINSGVDRFAECLVYYQQYRTSVRIAPEEEVPKLVAAAEEHMREADSLAFSDANNWWPVIIEQMNQGLL
jgi:hypothetical protein